MRARENWARKDEDAERALFLNERGDRLARSGVYDAVVKYAQDLRNAFLERVPVVSDVEEEHSLAYEL